MNPAAPVPTCQQRARTGAAQGREGQGSSQGASSLQKPWGMNAGEVGDAGGLPIPLPSCEASPKQRGSAVFAKALEAEAPHGEV